VVCLRARLVTGLLPFDELRLADERELADLEAEALPLDDDLALLDGAAFEPLEEVDALEDALLDDAEVRPEEEEPLEEVEDDRPDEDLVAADFLAPAELELERPPEDLLLVEERPEDARPEDWLRDFFISGCFCNDD
jgi:hypothetical protein